MAVSMAEAAGSGDYSARTARADVSAKDADLGMIAASKPLHLEAAIIRTD